MVRALYASDGQIYVEGASEVVETAEVTVDMTGQLDLETTFTYNWYKIRLIRAKLQGPSERKLHQSTHTAVTQHTTAVQAA